MDTTTQWPQGIGLVNRMQEFFSSTTTGSGSETCTIIRPQEAAAERRPRPHKEQALNCPRCNSTNTKFCYYNNYSLTQPRYFCKTCRRYWTEGGSLRNVPVGGGSRKNKRSSISSAITNNSSSSSSTPAALATASASKQFHTDHNIPPPSISLSTGSAAAKFHEGQDLKLDFLQHGLPEYNDHYPNLESSSVNNSGSNSNNTGSGTAPVGALSAMELLKSGMAARGIGPFMTMPAMPMPMPEYPSNGFGLQEFRPPNFPLDGISGGGSGGGGYGSLPGVQPSAAAGGKLLFPFEDLMKPAVVPSNSVADQFEQINRDQQAGDPPGFWNGIMGGGPW